MPWRTVAWPIITSCRTCQSPAARFAVLIVGRAATRARGDAAVVRSAPVEERAGSDAAAHWAGRSPVIPAAGVARRRSARATLAAARTIRANCVRGEGGAVRPASADERAGIDVAACGAVRSSAVPATPAVAKGRTTLAAAPNGYLSNPR